MKILLIYRVDISELSHSGVLLKMSAQKEALEQLGHVVDLVNHDKGAVYKNGNVLQEHTIGNRIKRVLNSYHSFFSIVSQQIDTSVYDLIYIRYPFTTPSFLNFCKRIKVFNSETKLFIEMPTFPYNREFKGLKKGFVILDNFLREKLVKYVDRLVHFGREDHLLGIPCINTTNGLDFSSIPLKSVSRLPNEIRLIAVAKWFSWHGLDRVINGLADFYTSGETNYDISLKVVGAGPEWNMLKKLVDRKGLSKKVHFVGIRRGAELDELFNNSDLAIGTLGMHRKGLKYNASLKHREYCARGIPFVLSTHDTAFPVSCGFVSYELEQDTNIEMEEIISLYNRGVEGKEIRNFGKENLEWSVIMKRIVDYV